MLSYLDPECGLYTSCGITRNLLEMQNPRPNPKPAELESAFGKHPLVIHVLERDQFCPRWPKAAAAMCPEQPSSC